MATGLNVLRVNSQEEQACYREAVAEILRNVQADHSVTLLDISEAISVSLGTVSNAANKKADLNSIYLQRIGCVYGPAALDPYAKMMGARLVAVQSEGAGDILPMLALTTHQIATARTPESPGGIVETLREQLGYLPELRRLRREIEALICGIEQRKDAA